MHKKPIIAPLRSLIVLLLPAMPAMAAFDADLFSGLSARSIGPAAVGGRIAAIDAVAADPNRIVIGAATGGVWISANGGLTWDPVFDHEAVASIGAIAINQSNPDIIWVGTGESNVRNSTSIGGGVYKTIDGGKTWKLSGLAASERIDRITLHPDNPDIAYVAAMGTLWGPNQERGIYKTADGGQSWQRILYVDEITGGTDIKMDPANPEKLYAAMWQFRRWPYQFKSGGPGSGLYISYDGGQNWQQKTEEDGLPEGELGRTVFAVSPAAPKRVYALVEAEKSALLRSDDGGEHWIKVNEEYNVTDRPFYYTELSADPANAERVYNIASRLRESIDGGNTFSYNEAIDCCAPGNTVHIDNHAFWINPGDSSHMIIGNDGGLAITRDRGETWRFVRNLPLAQFYHIAVDNDLPYNVYGGLQDNGSWRGPSAVWENADIRNLHWQEVSFGDGFDTRPDPENSRRGYSMSQGGFLLRWNLDTGEQRFIRPDPPATEVELRFNWNAGIAQDPFDTATIYYGSQFLHKSTDRGNTWSVISDDLTSNDPELQKYKESGGVTYDVTAAENYTTIVAIAPSKLERGLIWVGSDDGRIHVTRDGGETWSRIDQRARGVPDGSWVPMIAPSPHDPGTALVVFDDHRRSNMNTYVYRVENYGQRFTALQTDELSGYALSILQDPVDPALIFVGTEFGLFISTDAGDSWSRFTAGLPTVSVMDMAIQERETDLVLGTHGRAIYVIDDYSALRGLSERDFDTRLKLLSASNGQHYDANHTPSTRFTGSGDFRGENQPYGVLLTFMANGSDLLHPDEDQERERKIQNRRNAADDDDDSADERKITVKITAANGELLRTFKVPAQQGINRVVWGLERDGVRDMPAAEEADYEDGLPAGPEVPPGRYRITLSLDGADDSITEVTADVTTLIDPRTQYSQAEIQQNYQAMLEIMSLQDSAVTAVERIVAARDDVVTIKALIGKRDDAEDNQTLVDLTDRAGEISDALDELEKVFRTPPETKGVTYRADKIINRIQLAEFYVNLTYAAPGSTANSYFEIARAVLDEGTAAVNEFLAGELASFRGAVSAAGIGLLSNTEPIM